MATRKVQNLNSGACFSAFLALGVLFAGCGNPASLPPPSFGGGSTGVFPSGVACGAGQYNLGGTCIPAASFAQACTLARGTVTTVGGVEVCRMEFNIRDQYGATMPFPANLPSLSPGNPSNGYRLGIPVRQGDKLIWSASGGWGSTTANSYGFVGIGFDVFHISSCAEFTLRGVRVSNSVRADYNGYPAQLYGSDGTNVFALGTSVASHTIEADGELAIGFNVPQGQYNLCGTINFTNVRVRHCEDANRVTHPCP